MSTSTSPLPVVKVFGRPHCLYAQRAQHLLSAEHVNTLFSPESGYHSVDRQTLNSMEGPPNFRTSPRVYVDGFFLGGYSELVTFTQDRILSRR